MLTGKVAFVTGGGRGIGREIALKFALNGADVAVAARTVEEIEATAEECRSLGVSAVALPLDATDEDAWHQALNRAIADLGYIDILVNNAGGGIFKPITKMTGAEFDQVIAQNLRTVFLGMHVIGPHLMEREMGRIVNISSMAAYHAGADYPAYSAAKAGVNLLTEAMARELKEAGFPAITCNAICPGPVASQLRSAHFPDEDPASIMQPARVAEVALYLVSDQSSGISGTTINVCHY